MNLINNIKYARELVKSNYGRKWGWIVLLRGKPVAELVDYDVGEMFSKSYKIICSSEKNKEIAYNLSFWDSCNFTFKSRVTGEIVDDAFTVQGPEYIQDDRIFLRGLYLMPRNKVELFVVDIYQFLSDISFKRN